MKYLTIQPPRQLSRYVRFFWAYEGEASLNDPFVFRGFADTCTELVFHYRSVFNRIDGSNSESLAAAIHAQSREHRRYAVDRNWGIFGCYLYPFALPRLFSYPCTDFTDKITDFYSVLGSEGKELEERILTAQNHGHRIEVLSNFLIKRLNRAEQPSIFESLGSLIDTGGTVDVRIVARKYSLSVRQFERKFKDFFGFSPKLFSRINRFQAALKEYGSAKSLTAIALDCGYYDQSHFINDFKEFSGYNPKVYFSGSAEGSDYLEA